VYLSFIAIFLFFFFLSYTKKRYTLHLLGALLQNLYFFFLDLFRQQVESVRAIRFFPVLFSTFLFLCLLNLTSLLVFNISLTAHIFVTLMFSFSFFFGFFLIAVLNFGVEYRNFFIPKGVPEVLLYFIVLIEIISFVIRPFSLAIRLFANMLAGHTLLNIFTKFAVFVNKNFFLIFLLPALLLIGVFFLEFAVALVQAYIFINLLCIYLNDVYLLH
jgi:F-type H+-transporting ATPase subunit a